MYPQTSMAKILIADDNEDQATCLGMMFDIEGHHTEVVFDGQSAVDCAIQSPPDVVLLDINMPKLDGYASAQAIRASTRGRQPVVVALTAMGTKEDIAMALRSGFDAHMVKPVAFNELDQLLRRHAARRHTPY